MTTSIKTASMPTRRIMVAALVSALLSVGAFMAMSPSSASASPGNGRCESGEFCMGYTYNLGGGMYDNPNSDSKLYDNWFVPNMGQGVVDNKTWSVKNNGISYDVLIYNASFYRGTPWCLRRNRGLVNLPAMWRDLISSFQFVTPTQCSRYTQL